MGPREKLRTYLDNRLLEIKELKINGVKIIGYTPGGYMPEELVCACGALPVGLIRGGDHEAVDASAEYIPRFIDTFCRAQIGYKMSGDEPLYDMVDLLVVPVTDNNIKAIAECWNFYTNGDVFRFGVPHNKEDDAFEYYITGIKSLKSKLEKVTGVKITDEKLREYIAAYNKMRELLRDISLLRKSDNPPISSKEFIMLNHASFYSDVNSLSEILRDYYQELKKKKDAQVKSRCRVLLTGSTLAAGDYKVVDILEASGAAIVIEEMGEGIRHYWDLVEPDGDLIVALADRYFRKKVSPAFFRPSRDRVDWVIKLAEDFKVDGVVWYQLMYRESYDVQSYYFAKILKEKLGIPMLKVQSDYDVTEYTQLKNKIETFVEVIGR